MTTTAQRVREFPLPDVGEGLVDAEILTWHVRQGDRVTDGQVVCEVETAKASVELPIPYDGVVHRIHVEAGTTVAVGAVIISVDTGADGPEGAGAADTPDGPGTSATPAAPAAGTPDAEAPEARQPVLVGYGAAPGRSGHRPRRRNGAPAPTPAAPAAPAAPSTPPAPTAPAARTERPAAKPPVRKLAKDLGVDLAAVVPTGADGVVTRADVHAAHDAPPAPVPAPPVAAAPSPSAGETRIPVKGVRRATARAMVASAFTAPHVTEFVTVDVTRTMTLVRELKQDPELAGLRVSPLLLVARAFLLAIRRHPEVNARWDEENQEIVRTDRINLGIAAATERGLLVPNVKDAGSLTLPRLARALGELVTTAREGRTTPAALAGGTVTLTNIGVFGVDTGTPILNPGESAILAFGAVRERPWVHKGEVRPRQVTTLALSFDHRLVDGELGSKVLADTAAVLEHPKRLLTWA
ncbi:dihydrolipoamide acetyltransferase component of pyruvate dehydrogenase complex [Kitasatospora xanthocidica]|uniref:dihydrolipoamide acetyltransferase family protein n=1 Tax=Kitasatospora xanthocidica TaxID=83382 RepID=UPI00167A78F6|nr:dihydrolipoamide acetyltransferase family protein [Kitasatospora xanthocidica]GHF69218.1 dihydrolipoamide acetyltransferase component of pyruvate dehydrogenase complex [Kitasatospora xanthocidica]